MSDPDVRTELQRLADRRQRAKDEHREASVEMIATIRRAMAENVPMVEIARLSGISRQGIHKLLRASEGN